MGDITRLLSEWRSGNRAVENELFDLVLPELRRIARFFMKGEREGHSLQPTELVNQIYVRLVAAKDRDWRNRRDFFAFAAKAMRWCLIDHARGRPNGEFLPLDEFENFLPADKRKVELAITVDRLLEQLAEIRPDWYEVVEVKFFLGLTDEEAAEALGMALRTMQRKWRDARQWLFEQMDRGDGAAIGKR
jgi:RNA polymerase sigma factor (TIGR02999 family)